jgi:hypothetical protein
MVFVAFRNNLRLANEKPGVVTNSPRDANLPIGGRQTDIQENAVAGTELS